MTNCLKEGCLDIAYNNGFERLMDNQEAHISTLDEIKEEIGFTNCLKEG